MLLIALMVVVTVSSYGQTAYTDSIKAFQKKYVDELYPIIKNDTAFIRFYPVQKSLKIIAKVELLANQKPFKLTTSSGTSKEAEKLALVTFKINGKEQKLFAYQLLILKNKKETSNIFFIPFMDETSNNGSYGGGRYLDFEMTDIKDNHLTIDFNKAYSPYCAFVSGYNCPIPPKENTLNIAVKAGERYWKEKFVH